MGDILVLYKVHKDNGWGATEEVLKRTFTSEENLEKTLIRVASEEDFAEYYKLIKVEKELNDPFVLKSCAQEGKRLRNQEEAEDHFEGHVEWHKKSIKDARKLIKKVDNAPKFSVGDDAFENGHIVEITEVRKTSIGDCYKCERGDYVTFLFGWELSKDRK